jgi:sucrose-6-phosphate hydrolase SacC (GH32 family)
MNQKEWRNPHAVKRRAKQTAKKLPQKPPGNLAMLPTKKSEAKNMRISLLKMKDQLQGVREQFQQMEVTMDKLIEVMVAVERIGGAGKNGKLSNQAGLLKSFQHIDFKQVMNLIQSPLVQAFIETMAEDSGDKKK